MKAVIQRVTRARSIPGGEIGPGLCVLLGVADGDTREDAERLAGKVARLRIFQNEEGKFDLSLLDTGGDALVVSQFTLIADTGRATARASPAPRRSEVAEPLYEALLRCARGGGRVTSRAASSARACRSSS